MLLEIVRNWNCEIAFGELVLFWGGTNWNKVEMQTIPKAVATNMNLSSQKKVILMDQEENSWPIELRVRLDGRVDLAQGWREFLYDKKITVGDMLTFEFHSNILIHVNVECPAQADHPSHSASQSPSGFFNMAFEHVEPAVNYDGNHQTPETSQNSESVCSKFRRSSFPITWRETTHTEFLIIPKSVAEEQKLVNNQSIVVCDEGGKLWHMAVKVKPIVGCFLLSRGWSEFWQGNGITAGDTLNFEFISVGTVKVSIARASQTHDHTVSVGDFVDVKEETVLDQLT